MAQLNYHQFRFSYDPKRQAVWVELCRYLQRWVDPAGPLLELGAGYGAFTRSIQAGPKHALDLNPDLTRYWSADVHPIIQSALDPLPLEDGGLATVFAYNFFEHFTTEHGETILAEVKRLWRPGGRLIVVQPNFRLEPGRYFDDYTHRTAYTDAGFADFLRATGFTVVHTEPRFTPFSMKSRLPTAG